MFLSLVEGFSALLFGGLFFYIGRKEYRSVGSRYDILIHTETEFMGRTHEERYLAGERRWFYVEKGRTEKKRKGKTKAELLACCGGFTGSRCHDDRY